MHLLFAHIRDYVLLCKKLSQDCGFPINLKMLSQDAVEAHHK